MNDFYFLEQIEQKDKVIDRLLGEIERLEKIEKEHQRINGELREEVKRLKKSENLSYLESDELLNEWNQAYKGEK